MAITDMIISAIIKKGILYEARNVDINVKIPKEKLPEKIQNGSDITINFKAEHMVLKIEKE